MDPEYSNREIDHMVEDIHKKLDLILVQTTKHNGRLTKVERILLILGCVSGTILLMNGSALFNFIKLLIA